MSKWYHQHRMDWIAESVRVFGYINRVHLMRKYGISRPQASKDINTFMRLRPMTIAYDLSTKRYVPLPRKFGSGALSRTKSSSFKG